MHLCYTFVPSGATRGDPTGCKGGNFCQNPADMWCAGKPHAPSQLADVLRHPSGGGYNEMVLDVNFIEQHLPKAVDGIFYLKAGGKLSKGRAARVRAAFLQEHRIVNPTANFPLLVLDASREASQAGMPFSADLDTA